MKNIFSILLMAFSFALSAQNDQAGWFTNQSEAMAYAAEHEDNILMVFAGSDWCRPCIKFKKDILEAADFKEFAKGKIIILYLDFPSKKKNKLSKEATRHNEELAEKYNQSGVFPKIVLLDKEMKKLKDLSYEGQSTEQFIALIK